MVFYYLLVSILDLLSCSLGYVIHVLANLNSI